MTGKNSVRGEPESGKILGWIYLLVGVIISLASIGIGTLYFETRQAQKLEAEKEDNLMGLHYSLAMKEEMEAALLWVRERERRKSVKDGEVLLDPRIQVESRVEELMMVLNLLKEKVLNLDEHLREEDFHRTLSRLQTQLVGLEEKLDALGGGELNFLQLEKLLFPLSVTSEQLHNLYQVHLDDEKVLHSKWESQRKWTETVLIGGLLFTGLFSGFSILMRIRSILSFQRKTVNELNSSEIRLQTLTRVAPVGIFRTDPQGKCVYVNERWCEIAGTTPDAASGDGWEKNIHPDDRDRVLSEWDRFTREGGRFDLEYRFFNSRDKRATWVMGRSTVGKNNAGIITGYVGTVTDISERKEAEEALRESQRFHSTLMSNLPGMVYRYRNDKEWTMEYVSEGCLDLTGYSPSDLATNKKVSFSDLVHPEDRGWLWEKCQRSLEIRQPCKNEYRIIDANGKEKWVWDQAQGEYSGTGELLGIEGFITDVSTRKRAEEAVAESAERLDLAARAANLGIWDWDIVKDQLVWDDRMFALYGVRKENFGGAYDAWVAGLHPDDRARCKEETQQALSRESPYNTEFRVQRPDGTVRFLKGDGQIVRDPEGKPLRMTGINYDISERKQVEEKLRDSEERFRGSFLTAAVGMGMVDILGKFVEVNQAFCHITGYSEEELKKLTFQDITHPDDRKDNLKKQRKVWEGKQKGFVFEKRYIRKDGEIVWAKVSVGSIYNKEGVLRNTVGLIEDITERKRAEKGLTQFKAALDQTLDCVFMFSPETLKFVYVNRGAMEQVGYEESELLEMTPLNIKPEFTEKIFRAMLKPLKDGRESIHRFETIHRHKEGHDVPVEIALQFVSVGEEEKRFVAIVRDITIRKQQAAQIEASLKEKEVLLKEIHHRSKNNLQIISSLFNLQGNEVADPLTRRVFLEGKARIRAMALVHEKLYQSKDLALINFSDYIDELAGSVYRSYNMDPERILLETKMDQSVFLDIDSAIPYGLIINELLSNSLKYAFGKKKKGKVGIRLSQNNGDLEFTVWDNGIGLPSKIQIGKTSTLGLTLVDTLVRQTGGSLDINRGKGTAFRIRVPMDQ